MKFALCCLLSMLSLADVVVAQNWSLSYSTYLGPAGQLQPNAIPAVLAVNGVGDACITSRDQPTGVAALTELNSSGSQIYAVPLPNSTQSNQGLFAIAIDSSGDCYLAGVGTITPTSGVFQTAPKSGQSAQFVMKFNPTGGVVYATYLGGSGSDDPLGLAVDSAGNAYLTGTTASNDFPLVNALQSLYGGDTDAFIAVLNPAASALVYSTYLGGSGQEYAGGIAVDGAGNAYVTGSTKSADFPTWLRFNPH
jgi:hypothetical protein